MKTTLHPKREQSSAANSSGFGLIELMISITIASIVIAGSIAVFGGMRSTFTSQDRLAQLQDDQRLLLTVLTNTVQSSGYFLKPDSVTTVTAFPAVTAASGVAAFQAAQPVAGTVGTDSDTLHVRYQSDGGNGTTSNPGDGLSNCNGEVAAVNNVGKWTNNFAVDSTTKTLTCSVGVGTPEPLVGNVSSMRVLYLVELTPSIPGPATYGYRTATEVQSLNKWLKVLAVKVTVIFLDPATGQPLSNSPLVQTINLPNQTNFSS